MTTEISFDLLARSIQAGSARELLTGPGPFWAAMELAKHTRRRGDGVRVAVCDVGFAELPPADADDAARFAAHGAVVVGLISTFAPGAVITEHRFGRDTTSYQAALAAAGATQPQLVNVSAGKRRTLDEAASAHGGQLPSTLFTSRSRTEPVPSGYNCAYCPPAQALADSGAVVAAAVGNGFTLDENGRQFVFDAWCPALSPQVLSVGFTFEAPRGPVAEQLLPPARYQQGSEIAFAIEQPHGIEGSSFATPLAVAAMALVNDQTTLSRLLEIRYRHWLRMAWYPTDRLDSIKREATFNDVRNLMTEAQRIHGHGIAIAPCYECTLLLSQLLSDYGMLLIHVDQLSAAIQHLERAHVLVPSSPDLAANLGAAYRLGVERLGLDRATLVKSYECYRQANEIRPSPYFTGLLTDVARQLDGRDAL